jgi:hypothetical protein
MFSLFLLVSVRADALGKAESDIPEFVMGQIPSINPMETASLEFAMKFALEPKYPPIAEGTKGKIQIATDGFGAAVHLGPQLLDIFLSQSPEPGLPDKVDTIGFVIGFHTAPEGVSFSFALDFKGETPLQLCFSDTVANIAAYMQKMEGRRLQQQVDDLPPGVTVQYVNGSTEVISFPLPRGSYISDSEKVYEMTDAILVLTPPDNTGTTRSYASADLTVTGPVTDFELTAHAGLSKIEGPLLALDFHSPPIINLDLPVPPFCEDGSGMKLNIAAITPAEEKEVEEEVKDMELDEVGDKVARRLTGVETNRASKNIAVNVLKKLHSAGELFQAYKHEKERLMRMAFIQYSVVAVLALALLLSGGAVLRHSFRARKWGALAANDEEALQELVESTQ